MIVGPRLVPEQVDWHTSLYYHLETDLFIDPTGTHVGTYELSSGTNRLEPPRAFLDLFRGGLDAATWQLNTYSGPLGDDTVRGAVRCYENAVNGWSLDTDNVAMTAGAHEALQIAFRALHRMGHRHCLVVGPQVPLVFQAILRHEMSVREVWGEPDAGYLPSIREVMDAAQAGGCDVLFMASPNNPSGIPTRVRALLLS